MILVGKSEILLVQKISKHHQFTGDLYLSDLRHLILSDKQPKNENGKNSLWSAENYSRIGGLVFKLNLHLNKICHEF